MEVEITSQPKDSSNKPSEVIRVLQKNTWDVQRKSSRIALRRGSSVIVWSRLVFRPKSYPRAYNPGSSGGGRKKEEVKDASRKASPEGEGKQTSPAPSKFKVQQSALDSGSS